MSGFLVCAERCDQCLFSKNRVVSEARMRQLLADVARKDTHFICHKATIKGHDVACAGWYETRSSNLSRIAERLGMLKRVRVEDLPERAA